MRIMVVDDEPTIVLMCRRVLESQGHTVRGFTSVKSALADLESEAADLLVVDYKVRILDESKGTAAKTRVLITSGDGDETWGTVGVADNIIEASWQALVDSLEYKLRRDERRADAAR